MTTPTRTQRTSEPGHRLTPLSCGAFAMLLAVWVLCCTTMTSVSVATPTGLPCAGFRGGSASCAYVMATAQASAGEGEEEPEESEGEEEVASAEAEAEEAGARTVGSPSSRASSPSVNPSTGANVVVLSQLKLTASATAALRRRMPSASTVGFSFMLSAPAKVRVTLVKQTGKHGHKQWAALPDSLTVSAGKGRVSRSLTGHNKLSPGRYRLTVKPMMGRSRSIYLSARR